MTRSERTPCRSHVVSTLTRRAAHSHAALAEVSTTMTAIKQKNKPRIRLRHRLSI